MLDFEKIKKKFFKVISKVIKFEGIIEMSYVLSTLKLKILINI